MSIVLRVNKGSALTYDEMDRNQSQFFYSSSKDPSGTKLRLFYTGSTALNETGVDYGPRFQEIPFPAAPNIDIPEAIAAGNNTEIQFNRNGSFAADSLFTFDNVANTMGLGGTPNDDYKLSIYAEGQKPANIQLRSFSTTGTLKANVDFLQDSNILGSVGRSSILDTNIYLSHMGGTLDRAENDDERNSVGKVNISIGQPADDVGDLSSIVGTFTKLANTGDPTVGIGTQNPKKTLSVAGTHGIGISIAGISSNESYLQPLYGSILSSTGDGGEQREGKTFFVPNSSNGLGLLISSPNNNEGGNIVLNINTDNSQKEAFNIVSTRNSNFEQSGVNSGVSKLLASFKADKKHGINTQYTDIVGLTVEGSISSSGFVSIGEVPEEQNVGDVTVIGVDTLGKVHKSKAAPIPIGGIIMWSGAVDALPSGFNLCNGANGTPDLRDRFIAGASNTTGAPTTTVSGSNAVQSGGSAGIDSVILSDSTTLTLNQIPSHTHTYRDTMFSEESGNSSRIDAIDNVDLMHAGRHRNSSTDSNGNALNSYSIDRVTGAKGGSQGHGHFITLDLPTVPPFYALAYIMYTG